MRDMLLLIRKSAMLNEDTNLFFFIKIGKYLLHLNNTSRNVIY